MPPRPLDGRAVASTEARAFSQSQGSSASVRPAGAPQLPGSLGPRVERTFPLGGIFADISPFGKSREMVQFVSISSRTRS